MCTALWISPDIKMSRLVHGFFSLEHAARRAAYLCIRVVHGFQVSIICIVGRRILQFLLYLSNLHCYHSSMKMKVAENVRNIEAQGQFKLAYVC
jgi:hypothetical protein